MAQQHTIDNERGPCVAHSLFCVNDYAPGERYDVWKESIASIFDVEAEKDVAAHFQAILEAYLIGPLMLARTETRQQRWTRSARRMALDGMDHYLIQYFEKGRHVAGLDEAAGRAPDDGYIVVFDLSRPLANVTSDFRNLSLLVPRPLLSDRLERPDEMHNLIITGSVGRLLCKHLQTLHALSPTLEMTSVNTISEGTIALVAACLNDADTGAIYQDHATSSATIMQIKRFIDANLHDRGLTAEVIARAHGVSRSKLYMMFEPHGGVAAYMRARRLQIAFHALRDRRRRHRSLYDIALDAGYNNDAAFCRAFKSQFGITPSEVRRQRLIPAERTVNCNDANRRYEHWLHRLGAL